MTSYSAVFCGLFCSQAGVFVMYCILYRVHAKRHKHAGKYINFWVKIINHEPLQSKYSNEDIGPNFTIGTCCRRFISGAMEAGLSISVYDLWSKLCFWLLIQYNPTFLIEFHCQDTLDNSPLSPISKPLFSHQSLFFIWPVSHRDMSTSFILIPTHQGSNRLPVIRSQ